MNKKIVHINSSGSGGAYAFVKLLNVKLLINGIDSKILTRFFQDKSQGVLKHTFGGNISVKRFLKKVFCSSVFKKDAKFEIFSESLKTSSVMRNRCVKGAEIIHLHWVADLVSVFEIAQMTKTKRVLWTMHDMNPFTGGCHHSDDCEQFLSECADCPQLGENGKKVSEFFRLKREAIDKIDKDSLTIISPSKWMFEKASKSSLLKKFNHLYVPHFIDTETFKYTARNTARALINLHQAKTIFLYISAVLENERKGFNEVLESIKNFENRDDVLFILIGNAKNASVYENRKNVMIVGNIADPKILSNYYSASDFLINLTVAESFGLTTVESLCCGTPVICYDIPIMREHIEDGMNGIFVNADTPDIIEKVDLFIKKGKTRLEISTDAGKKYGDSNFQKYVELYTQ